MKLEIQKGIFIESNRNSQGDTFIITIVKDEDIVITVILRPHAIDSLIKHFAILEKRIR